MTLLNIQSVSKFYGKQDVLKEAAFTLNPGERVGLVGRNGAGKTTLIRLILEQESPDQGAIHRAKGLRLGYLPQDLMNYSGQSLLDLVMDTAGEIRAIEAELDEINHEIDEISRTTRNETALLELTDRQSRLFERFDILGGYTLEIEARKILQGLGFETTDMHRRIEEFSGGWIMRAALARLLLAGPDLLLLDEPTNHLDIDSLLWLENYLRTCSSALLLVSHDRVFINNVVHRIVEVERGQTTSYSGNYDQYLEEKERRFAAETAAFANQQERIKQIEKFIEKNKAKAFGARRAQSRMKMLDKMDKVEAPLAADDHTFNLVLPPPRRGPDTLVELREVTKTYGGAPVYEDLDFMVRRGDRIAFIGPNGRGKSTLLKLISGALDFQEGQRRVGTEVVMGYFAQFQLEELDLNRTVIDELASVAGDMTQGKLRSILGSFLFRGDDVFKKVAVLSGGEKTRLILAKIMIIGPNLLLLDEPTNHLDIPGRDMLEQALDQYEGTLCLISHDRHLINHIANKILVINDGRVEVLPGTFDDYQNIWQARIEANPLAKPKKEKDEPAKASNRAEKVQSRAEKEARKKAEAEARQKANRTRGPLVKKVEQLENRISELNEKLSAITASLADPATYQDAERSKKLNLEYAGLKQEIERKTQDWEAASLELEELDKEIAGA